MAQHWWSFAGWAPESVRLTDLQPLVRYRATDTLNIGFAQNIQYDWNADQWSIPVGGGFDITVRFGDVPVRIGMEGYYYVDQFAGVEDQWGIRLFFAPVVPAPAWASTSLFGG